MGGGVVTWRKPIVAAVVAPPTAQRLLLGWMQMTHAAAAAL